MKWNNLGGDARNGFGQAYDQIHAIKLHGRMYFRRAYSGFGYEANTGKIQPLSENLEETIESLVEDLEDKRGIGPEKRSKVASFWKDRVQENIDQKLPGFYFDLDGYSLTIEKITAPEVVKTVFCLYDSEAKALRDTSAYLKKEHQTPNIKQTDCLFKRAVKRLLDYDGTHLCPHPGLSESDIFSLVSAHRYLDNLNTAFRLTKSKKQ